MNKGSVADSKALLNTLVTIKDYVRWGASELARQEVFLGHGIATFFHESATIVFFALHLPQHLDDSYLDSILTMEEREQVFTLLNRRIIERIPVAYLVNQASFAGLSFFVDERVLVPRSPISELIEQQFSPWGDAKPVNHILDLCTGSGCIAIACAYAFAEAQVDAVEWSEAAMQVAEINLRQHELEDRLHLYHSDLFNQLPEKKYDIIVSNPPYVSFDEWQRLPEEYHHEPQMGFTANDNGLALVFRILAQAGKFLQDDGILVVEVGASAEPLQQCFPHVPFLWLEFEQGGDGVFLLTAKQLKQYHDYFRKFN